MNAARNASTVRVRLRRQLPLWLLLIPVAVSLAAGLAGAKPSESQPSTPLKPLAFHQYMLNLGMVPALPEHIGIFAFTNTGDVPVRLRRLQTSCGCLTSRLDDRVYLPGETGDFYLRIQSAGQTPGPHQYTCTAYYGPPDDESVEFSADLAFRLTLPEQSVTVQPRALIFHQRQSLPRVIPVAAGEHRYEAIVRHAINQVVLQAQARVTHSVQVTDLRGHSLNVTAATCDSPLVHVALESPSDLSAGDRVSGIVARVNVSVGIVPPGDHEVLVRIHTDDPEFHTLLVPARIHGPSALSNPQLTGAEASGQ